MKTRGRQVSVVILARGSMMTIMIMMIAFKAVYNVNVR